MSNPKNIIEQFQADLQKWKSSIPKIAELEFRDGGKILSTASHEDKIKISSAFAGNTRNSDEIILTIEECEALYKFFQHK